MRRTEELSSFNPLVRVGLRVDFGTMHALVPAVIDPPVTPEERLADAMAAFGLLCDRAIEYLDMLGWQDTLNVESPGGSS